MTHTQNERNIIFLSTLKQVEMLEGFLSGYPHIREEGFLLVPLDLEVEYMLKEKGMPFESGGAYRTMDTAVMTLAEDWTTSVFESERWSFFKYRGVSLSQLYFLPLQWYLSHVIYYTDIIANVLAAHTEAIRLVVFSPLSSGPAMGSTLVTPQIRVIVDAVECVARENNKEALVVPEPALSLEQFQSARFMQTRVLFGVVIRALNVFVTFFRRPRKIRVLASDYWKNLAPYVNDIDSLEITLIDRKEALKAGFSNIWKYRMRFLHLDAFSSKRSSEHTFAHDLIAKEWQTINADSQLPLFDVRGISVRPIVSSALDLIVGEVLEKILADIDDTHAMFLRIKPHVVLLRATISTQTHFIILAQVARSLGVPSLEVQHGLEYLGPGSYTRRHSAEFMGVYGALIKNEMERVGGSRSTGVVIGSPRFDVYASVLKEKINESHKTATEDFSFLCVAPAIDPGGDLDTYDYEEFFSAIAGAVRKIPNASAIIKFRPGPNRDSFARTTLATLFVGVPYTIAQFEPLSDLYPKADIVISCFSTAAIEAMQCGKPLVYLGVSPAQSLMGLDHFTPYAEVGAIKLATTKKELEHILVELAHNPETRNSLAAKGVAFLESEYAFDGRGSERTANLVKQLASGKR